MNKQVKISAFLFIMVSNVFMYGQDRSAFWLSIGVNAVDDSGKQFSKPFDLKNNWNFSIPFLASFEYDMTHKISVGIQVSHNQYLEGKLVNGAVLDTRERYMAIDVLGKYYFENDIFVPWNLHYRWKAFITSGICACIWEDAISFNVVLGGGINYRISDLIKAEAQMLPKIGVISDVDGDFNHFQYVLKLSYRF